MPFKTEFKTFHEFTNGEVIVGMVAYNGRVIVATSQHVYEIEDGKLHRIAFETMKVV